MALIKCPDCGKEISDQTKACPNCGRPISANQEKQKQNATARPSAKTIIMVVGIIAAIIAMVFIYTNFIQKKYDSKEQMASAAQGHWVHYWNSGAKCYELFIEGDYLEKYSYDTTGYKSYKTNYGDIEWNIHTGKFSCGGETYTLNSFSIVDEYDNEYR